MSQAQTHRVLKLADRIQQDIRRRQLRAGDPYLNTDEVAQMLKVSKQAANQAMQVLAQRRLLARRQRSGTCIADPDPQIEEHPIQSLLMLVHQSYLRTEGLLADGVVVGISRRLPRVHVGFAYTPSLDDEAFVRQTVKQSLRDANPTGLLLVRASLMAQRIVAESGLPAVIYGTPQPSIDNLSSIDSDQRDTGYQIATHMVAQGHQRVAVMMRDRLLPGDRAFQDGVRQAAAEHGLGVDCLIHRGVPSEHRAIVSECGALIRSFGPGLGIIARTERIAEGAVEAVKQVGMRLGRDIGVAIAHIYRRGNENQPTLPYVKTLMSPQDQGETIANLLCAAALGNPVETVRLPVQLILPDEDA